MYVAIRGLPRGNHGNHTIANVCTLIQEVAIQEKKLYSIASTFGSVFCEILSINFVFVSLHSGLAGGEENGRRGYQLTFAIAYIRVRYDVMITSSVGERFSAGFGV